MTVKTKVKKDAEQTKEAKAEKLLGKALGTVASEELEESEGDEADEGEATTNPTGAKAESQDSESSEDEKENTGESSDKLLDKVIFLSASLATSQSRLDTAKANLTRTEVEIATAKADMGTLKMAAAKACRIYAQQLGIPTVDYTAMSPDALAVAYLDLDVKFKASIPDGQMSEKAGTEGNDPQSSPRLHPISGVK